MFMFAYCIRVVSNNTSLHYRKLFSGCATVMIRIGFSVWLVNGYAHVFILHFVAIVTLHVVRIFPMFSTPLNFVFLWVDTVGWAM